MSQPTASEKLYIVTQDLDSQPLWKTWRIENQLELPPAQVFKKIRQALHNDIQKIGFEKPTDEGITVKVNFEPIKPPSRHRRDFWITLDDIYVTNSDFVIKATRIYNRDGVMLKVGPRPGSNMMELESQIAQCRVLYDQKGRPPKVVLADDGVFKGKTLSRVLELLDHQEVFVTEIQAAVSTSEGEITVRKNRPKHSLIFNGGMGIGPEESHIDWVCERDFFLGVPRSGKTTDTSDCYGSIKSDRKPKAVVGYPYVEPWGPMEKGASILQNRTRLSERLTSHAIELWGAFEKQNKRKLTLAMLPRFPGPGIPHLDEEGMPLIKYLEREEKRHFGKGAKKRREANPIIR